jgi:hypothetical protein
MILESHDGVRRPLKSETTVLEGPAGLKIPVCTFDGFIRTTAVENSLHRTIFEAAFPGFHTGEEHDQPHDILRGRFRRYAGSAATLTSDNYASVARWDRGDRGGLVREIFAYANPKKTGIVIIDDMLDPRDNARINKKYVTRFEPGEYLLLFAAEPEKLIPEEHQERVAASVGGLPNFYSIPCVTRPIRIEKVVDLRLAATQDWFFKTFSKQAWYTLSVPLPPMDSFLEFLMFLFSQNRGGNALTQAVGRELRLWGVNGLVYPSARCDCELVMEDGDVVDWYGWNLVDYSKTCSQASGFNPSDAGSLTAMSDNDNLSHGSIFSGLPIGQIQIDLEPDGTRRGSWKVEGLEDVNLNAWVKKLSAGQRTRLGLTMNKPIGSERGLHKIEKRFQAQYRKLANEHGELGIDRDTVRRLLAALAIKLMDLPEREKTVIDSDTMAKYIGLADQQDAFKHIVMATGMLKEEPKGNFRFVDKETFDYFTIVGGKRYPPKARR